jgi:transposase InsO family protein
VATEYVTKWTEAIATKNDDANTVARFVYENIIIRFGCPKELVSDRGTHIINSTIEKLLSKYMIKHCKSTPYHPRANGQTKKTNGILCEIITKTIQGSNTDWDQRIFDALWAYRTAYKTLVANNDVLKLPQLTEYYLCRKECSSICCIREEK